MNPLRICMFILTLTAGALAHAGLEEFQFGDGVSEDRFKALIAEIRCLVCQNQSLADSDAELAQDLREQVYELMAEGQSDTEIQNFLVNRYGDFVLYKPPIKPSTYLLWAGPFVLLALGLALMVRTLRQRRALESEQQSLSDDEQRRLQDLLQDRGDGPEDSR